MKKIFAIFGFVSTAAILLLVGFIIYKSMFPLKAEQGDLIVFQTAYNGPESTTSAYILRGEYPNTQLIGELSIPNELKSGEIKGKFFDVETSTLYFTNENGFYSYNLDNGIVDTIKAGQGGFTFKNIDGKIWYNLDVGFDQTKPENGYTNQLCEYSISSATNECRDIHNMQIFDVALDKDNYYLVGYSSDYNNFNNMIQTFGVFDKNFNQIEKFTTNFDGGWLPELFVDSQDKDKIILNNEVIYYSYDKINNDFSEYTPEEYTTFLSDGNKTYYISGGESNDYNQGSNCTRIGFTGEEISCLPGRMVIVPFYDGYKSIPNSNGYLVRPNTIILSGGIIEEYVNIIDLNSLTEIKRFNLVEPISSVKDAIYIAE